MERKFFQYSQKIVSVLFFQKPFKHKEVQFLVYSLFASVESSFLNIWVISANFNSLGKFLLLITCSFQVLAKCSLLISEVSFSISVGIRVLLYFYYFPDS